MIERREGGKGGDRRQKWEEERRIEGGVRIKDEGLGGR